MGALRFMAALAFAVALSWAPGSASAHEVEAAGAWVVDASVAASSADQDGCERSRSGKADDASCCASACHAVIPTRVVVLDVRTVVAEIMPVAPQPRIASGRLRNPTPPPKAIGPRGA